MSKILWSPSEERIKNTNMFNFIRYINSKYGHDFNDYTSIYNWSIENIEDFWRSIWDFCEIKASKRFYEVIDDIHKMPGAKWFSGARLNFAENLLKYDDDSPAIIAKGEDRDYKTISYNELYFEVANIADALKKSGVKELDRIAAYMPNIPETITAMLASASIGALWSSCSPDFGESGVLDRFGQITPKIFFAADGYKYKGKGVSCLDRIAKITKKIDSIEKVVIIPYLNETPDISNIRNAVLLNDFKSNNVSKIDFNQLPFNHPLYIMYSSGTTGLPKCMVQSAGGVLINHLKELILHTDIKEGDKIFYFTTCGWMMWNWLTSALSAGATIVLYEGNPFYPDNYSLWKMADDLKINVFGTSAGYLSALMASGSEPINNLDLSSIKTILSTGSPLSSEGFDFVYSKIKKDVQLSSISGGTDLNGCFALGNSIAPVYEGELQCRGLGMAVNAFDDSGHFLINRKGELVCTQPFPSMPIFFWDDQDNKKYLSAYFDNFPNIWCHGDYIEIRDNGGVVIYGRSDATLNPQGVRIGTADIYREIEKMSEIEDSVVIGHEANNDVKVILFVKMKQGFELTEDMITKIKSTIRKNASPRHVPDKIFAVPDIPYTLNMKKVELAVKKSISGQEVKNKSALKNPEALDYFENLAKELES
ncbi:MAG: acetoacetate--CoA ligase [Desulfobacterales bacterium]|nr:acetoacetate--CoA ligase [Desulfobacterales bacterium]